MYGRACNYGKFRQSEEIRNFLQDDFNPQKQTLPYVSKYPQSDLNLSELLLNNKFCPLLQNESWTYIVISVASVLGYVGITKCAVRKPSKSACAV